MTHPLSLIKEDRSNSFVNNHLLINSHNVEIYLLFISLRLNLKLINIQNKEQSIILDQVRMISNNI